jgi:hypothetical protein
MLSISPCHPISIAYDIARCTLSANPDQECGELISGSRPREFVGRNIRRIPCPEGAQPMGFAGNQKSRSGAWISSKRPIARCKSGLSGTLSAQRECCTEVANWRASPVAVFANHPRFSGLDWRPDCYHRRIGPPGALLEERRDAAKLREVVEMEIVWPTSASRNQDLSHAATSQYRPLWCRLRGHRRGSYAAL